MKVVTAILVDEDTGEPVAAVVNDAPSLEEDHGGVVAAGMHFGETGTRVLPAPSSLGRFFGSVAVGVAVEAFSAAFLRRQ